MVWGTWWGVSGTDHDCDQCICSGVQIIYKKQKQDALEEQKLKIVLSKF